jgi:hypothetical protein
MSEIKQELARERIETTAAEKLIKALANKKK